MKVLIVEDEQLAAEGLVIKLKSLDANVEILGVIDTVESCVNYIKKNPMPDLCFFDIQLADGLSFEIFEQVAIECPIVFTTAYDAFALKAFEVNSIDYLLKPISKQDLEKALHKLKTFQKPSSGGVDLKAIQQLLESNTRRNYKSRFMTKVGEKLLAYDIEEISSFIAENKIVWMVLFTGRRYSIDYKMEELQTLIDPEKFFRLNRGAIANFKAITNVVVFSNSRLKIELKGLDIKESMLVSRENVEEFRIWYGK